MKTDVLVLGSGPAGITAALTAKRRYPERKVTVVRERERCVIPCAIPYIFRRLDNPEKILISDKLLKNAGVEILTASATEIDKESKKVILSNREEISYEKLILALGSKPRKLGIEGEEKRGVWYIEKDFEHLKKLREHVLSSKHIVLLGGGFTGVEIAEELSGIEGKQVTIVEKFPHCLFQNFDKEFCEEIEAELRKRGVRILTSNTVEKILGSEKVEGILLSNGERIKADCVIIAAGSKPNVELAERAGIKLGKSGAIAVDEHMRTSEHDIYACGDCAEKMDFFTGKPVQAMLASVATREARIAASNLYGSLRKNNGTLGSFSTTLFNRLFACAGYTEKRAEEEGFETRSGFATAPSTHPAALGGEELRVKLLFLRKNGILLGAQVSGPERAAELVNTLTLAMERGATVHDLCAAQISTHPLLTPAPTVYPVILAAQEALSRMQ